MTARNPDPGMAWLVLAQFAIALVTSMNAALCFAWSVSWATRGIAVAAAAFCIASLVRDWLRDRRWIAPNAQRAFIRATSEGRVPGGIS